MNKPKLPVTLVIPHRNRLDHITECVESVIQMDELPAEILIIDDNSNDSVLGRMRDAFARYPVRIIALPENIGRVNAKNLGISLCKTGHIWFLDSDVTILFPNTLSYAFNLLKNRDEIAVAGGELIKGTDGLNYFAETKLLPNYESRFEYYPIDSTSPGEIVKYVRCIPTCNFLTETAVIKKAGGFHPFLIQGEDKLASLEIHKNKKLLISSRCAVLHKRAHVPGQEKIIRRDSRRCNNFIYGASTSVMRIPFYYFDTALGMLMDFIFLRKRLHQLQLFSKSMQEDEPKNKDSIIRKILGVLSGSIALHFRRENIKSIIEGIEYRKEKKEFPSPLILRSIEKHARNYWSKKRCDS